MRLPDALVLRVPIRFMQMVAEVDDRSFVILKNLKNERTSAVLVRSFSQYNFNGHGDDLSVKVQRFWSRYGRGFFVSIGRILVL